MVIVKVVVVDVVEIVVDVVGLVLLGLEFS